MSCSEFYCNDCGYQDYNCHDHKECPNCDSVNTEYQAELEP